MFSARPNADWVCFQRLIQIIKLEPVLKLLARTQITSFGFEVEKILPEIEQHEIRTHPWLLCEIRVEKNYRPRSGYECCCCCCCCCCSAAAARCACCMLYGSHAKDANQRLRVAMRSECVRRAVRCACVAPEPTARRLPL